MHSKSFYVFLMIKYDSNQIQNFIELNALATYSSFLYALPEIFGPKLNALLETPAYTHITLSVHTQFGASTACPRNTLRL